jgi:hypothetical protein
VEHGISHLKNRRALSHHLGRREHLDTILRAVAGLVSSQERTPRLDDLHRPPKVHRPAPLSDPPRPGQGNDRPPLITHEVV